MTTTYHAPEATPGAGPEVQSIRQAAAAALLAAASEVEKLADPDEDDLALEFGEDILSDLAPVHEADTSADRPPENPHPPTHDEPGDPEPPGGDPPLDDHPELPAGPDAPAQPATPPVREAEIDDPHAPDRGMRIDDVPQETIDRDWHQHAEDDIREESAAIADQMGEPDADEPGGLSFRLSDATEHDDVAGFGEHDGLRSADAPSETEDALRNEFRAGEPPRSNLDPLAREAASAMTEIAAETGGTEDAQTAPSAEAADTTSAPSAEIDAFEALLAPEDPDEPPAPDTLSSGTEPADRELSQLDTLLNAYDETPPVPEQPGGATPYLPLPEQEQTAEDQHEHEPADDIPVVTATDIPAPSTRPDSGALEPAGGDRSPTPEAPPASSSQTEAPDNEAPTTTAPPPPNNDRKDQPTAGVAPTPGSETVDTREKRSMFRRRRKHETPPGDDQREPRRPPKRGRALLALLSITLLLCLGGLTAVIADPREWPYLPGVVPSSTLEALAVIAGHPARPITLAQGSVAIQPTDPDPQPLQPDPTPDAAEPPATTAALPPTGLGDPAPAKPDLPKLDWHPFDAPESDTDGTATAETSPPAEPRAPDPAAPPGDTSLPVLLQQELQPLARDLATLRNRSDAQEAQLAALGTNIDIILESLPHPAALADHRLETIEERLIELRDTIGDLTAEGAGTSPPSRQVAASNDLPDPPQQQDGDEDARSGAADDLHPDAAAETPVRPTPVARAQTWRPGRVWQAPAAHFQLSTRIPADLANVEVGDWLPGYGYILHVAPTNGGRLINTENGALFDPEPGTAAPPASGPAAP